MSGLSLFVGWCGNLPGLKSLCPSCKDGCWMVWCLPRLLSVGVVNSAVGEWAFAWCGRLSVLSSGGGCWFWWYPSWVLYWSYPLFFPVDCKVLLQY